MHLMGKNLPDEIELPESDDLDAMLSAPVRADAAPLPGLMPATFEEPCSKCRGRGRFVSYSGRDCGPCFTCKGTGKQIFKTSRDDRAKRHAQSDATKARKAQDNVEAFKLSNPDVWAWLDGNIFEFAIAMREALAKYGYLTDRQLAACVGAIQKRDAAKIAAVQRVETAKTIDMTQISAAFARAAANLKKPKLRVAGFALSPAKASSQNAGALYVKAGEQYLGKIVGEKFIRSRECTDEQEANLLDVAIDPMKAAVAYGRLTGNCACCGRALSDPESIARGIGPVCAENFGWGA